MQNVYTAKSVYAENDPNEIMFFKHRKCLRVLFWVKHQMPLSSAGVVFFICSFCNFVFQ